MPDAGLQAWERVSEGEVLDLAHGMKRGIPVSPNHPAFQMALLRRHGDMMRQDGSSAANELIVTGGHVGTHMDALAHVSQDGLLHGGIAADEVTSHEGFSAHGIDTFQPLLSRGVLLDVPRVLGTDVCDAGYEVTVDDLERAEKEAGARLQPGDAALIRTGWANHYEDPERFVGLRNGAPGPGAEAAAWLAERGVAVAGAETIAFEVIRAGAGHALLPAHRILLVDAGINILEVMDLRPLVDRDVRVFGFIAAPLKLVGATGSPLRPLAVVL